MLNAFRRQSRSHCGSSFLAEMKRTVSSLRPFGAKSDSMSVMKPYLYSPCSERSDSIVCWVAVMVDPRCSVLSFLGEQTARSCRPVRGLQFGRGHGDVG